MPGGGYGALAEHEGRGYAEYFAAAGIAAFVVTYRLGTDGFRHPAMLEDALAALRAVRARADGLGLDPQRIGIMGSSAGGHLASQALVAWHTYESDVSLRPDFGIMCYPVIASQGPYAHAGSMRNLAGQDPSSETLNMLSSDLHVGPDTPPCFLWHTGEDAAVPLENSMLFASALRARGVPFELHLCTVAVNTVLALRLRLIGAPSVCAGSERLRNGLPRRVPPELLPVRLGKIGRGQRTKGSERRLAAG